MKKPSIAQRIQSLEDKEAIKDITYCYALHINKECNGMETNPDALREIFAEDAVWGSSQMNIHEVGIDNIIGSLREETKTVLFAMHSYSNPVIRVSGSTATGNWLFWVVSKWAKDTTNQVFMSQDIQYIRLEDGWRIQEVNLHVGELLKHQAQD